MTSMDTSSLSAVPSAATASSSAASFSSSSSSSPFVSFSSSSSSVPPRGLYVVHAQAPTLVTHSLTCHFTSPTSTNLVLARGSRLDLMQVQAGGLSLVKELPIYGRVAALSCFLPTRSSSLHRLLVSTEAQQLFVLGTDPVTHHFVTHAAVDLTHRVGQLSDHGHSLLVSPQQNLIVAHMYEGVLSCIPVDAKGALGEVVDVRVEESRVLDVVFLHGHARPTLALLHVDHRQKRHVRTVVLDVREREARPGPVSLSSLDHSPARLIPCEDGGLLVVGEESVVWYSREGKPLSHVLLTPCTPTSWTRIDANRFLLADLHGDLHMLILQQQQQQTQQGSAAMTSASSPTACRLHLELLGAVTIASTMSYLGDSCVFLGSTLGDHQLVRLHTERGEDGSFVQLVDSFPNLGSIVDMAVMDLDQQGQGQLVTCSGAFQCGSLRVVRNGVGVDEEASIELPGIQGMWGIKAGQAEEGGSEGGADAGGAAGLHHKYLVQSFVGETRVLMMADDELSEMEMEGLDAQLPALHCNTLDAQGRSFLQLTERSARVISTSTLQLLGEWKERRITVGSSNERGQLLLAMGRELVLLRWADGRLREEKRLVMEHEVACLDLTPMTSGSGGEGEGGVDAAFAVVGLWTDLSLRVLSLPSLVEVSRAVVGGEVIPRSVLLCPFSPTSAFLLAGLGDGRLLSFAFHPTHGSLSQRKAITIGTQPITLTPFTTTHSAAHSSSAAASSSSSLSSSQPMHVFAACDRPTVVHCVSGRLLYSNVNLKDVHLMAPFSTPTFPSSLAFASSTHLVLGPIDALQRLHIQTIPLQAQPRKVAWMKEEHCLLVLVSRFVRDESRRGQQGVQWREVSELLALDDESFAVQSRLELQANEVGSALFVTREPLQGELLVVVGATVVVADESMPKRGRLLLLRVERGQQLQLLSSTATKGAVYSIDQVLGRIVVGINSKVVVYRCLRAGGFDGSGDAVARAGGGGGGGGGELHLLAECSYVGKTVSLVLSTFSHYVVVGDLLQSVAFLVYSPASAASPSSPPTLELVARDWDSASITALQQLWPQPALNSGASSNSSGSSGAAAAAALPSPAASSSPSSAPPPLFLACDALHNLFYFHRSGAGSEEERSRVELVGKFHLGDFVNAIRPGSLVMATQSTAHAPAGAAELTGAAAGVEGGGGVAATSEEGGWGWRVQGSVVMGSVSGALLVVAALSRDAFVWLSQLEEALEKVIGGLGRLDHKQWRAWKGERGRKDAASVAVVDGDLIEMTLELRGEQQTQLSQLMAMPWHDILRRVEEVSRIH